MFSIVVKVSDMMILIYFCRIFIKITDRFLVYVNCLITLSLLTALCYLFFKL
uniref:Uncharacterized protein n=1 Tax=Polysiphonia sertularioides TaxID=945028 RepID=A0A1Z1MG85_9FLOR|nr:hypothetical protein [Polysiphonia sertularioides]